LFGGTALTPPPHIGSVIIRSSSRSGGAKLGLEEVPCQPIAVTCPEEVDELFGLAPPIHIEGE
jgi:hypothetical protein